MLVFTLNTGQSFHIGDNIKVTVLETRGSNGQVRVGIDAPREIQVHRDVVYQQLMDANQSARRSGAASLPALPKAS